MAAIAMIRIPANVSTDSEEYRGPVLFNPGGPGQSGVELIQESGAMFSTLLGPQFDILGFDTRGVGHSTPGVSFFESDVERALWGYDALTHDLNLTQDALGQFLAKAVVTNQLAKARSADVTPYIHTDFTARDMLKIVEAHGRDKLQYFGIS